jgi:membrane protein DedA with SNARE-associated domain
METVGWIAIVVIAVAIGFTLGYWFGYRCGQHDAESGLGAP